MVTKEVVMFTEQEKKLVAEADAVAKSASHSGLERYLTGAARAQVKDHPSLTAWAIHFHGELCRQQEKNAADLHPDLLHQAHRLAEAAVAHEVLGESAFDFTTYLADRKMRDEFLQVVQRYRGRLMDPSIKAIVIRMAESICAGSGSSRKAA